MAHTPVVGALRVSHHHLSTVVQLPAEHAAVALERHIRALRHLGGRWGVPVPREAPHGTSYWPRLTVLGRLEILGRVHDVELEVWPWDEERAEVGLRPVAERAHQLPDREAWVVLGSGVLADVVVGMSRRRSLACHPAGVTRRHGGQTGALPAPNLA